MDWKTSKAKSNMDKIHERRDSAIGRRVKKRRELKPAKELNKEWIDRMKYVYPDSNAEDWGAAEMSLASNLVKKEGFDRAVDAIRHFIDTWNSRRRDDSIPVFKIFWVMRETILAELDGLKSPPMTSEERLGIGETDRTRDNPDKVSWSDLK